MNEPWQPNPPAGGCNLEYVGKPLAGDSKLNYPQIPDQKDKYVITVSTIKFWSILLCSIR